MAASLDELLRGAQRLSQHDGSSFAPIRRDLSQIRAQTANLEARTARADGEGGEAERRAQAVLFLARRGVDATAMDTDGLLRELDQSDEPYFDPASDAPPDDIDGWLQAQRERIVSATIDGARAHTSADFFACAQDRWQVQWRQDHALTLAALSHRSGGWQPADMNSWQAGAPQQFAQQAANVPAAAGLRAPGGLADSGVGLVREPKAAAYAMALLASHASIAASVQVGGRGASQWSGAGAQPDALVCRFSEVPAKLRAQLPGGTHADSLRKAAELWALLQAMTCGAVEAAEAERSPPLRPADEGAWRARSPELLRALLAGALSQLGSQFRTMADVRVSASANEAARGGLPGWEHSAAAHVRVRLNAAALGVEELRRAAASGLPCCELVTLGAAGASDVPLWAVLFACVRANEWAAASRALDGARQALPRLAGATDALSAALRGTAAARGAPVAAQTLTAAEAEYSRCWADAAHAGAHSALDGSGGGEAHAGLSLQLAEQCALVYAQIAAVPLAAGVGGGGGRRSLACAEDYVWHKVGVVVAKFDAHGAAAGKAALAQLQELLAVTYGERHFVQGGGSDWLFASVLIASAQFEKAVAYLSRAAGGAFRVDALHIALGLHACGLLATDEGEGVALGGVDGGLEVLCGSKTPSVRLSALLEAHASQLFAESAGAALRYAWLVQPEARKLSLASRLIVEHGRHRELLVAPSGASRALDFLAPLSRRQLALAVANALETRGEADAAAQLLVVAQEPQRALALAASALTDSLRAAPDAAFAFAADGAGRAAASQCARAASACAETLQAVGARGGGAQWAETKECAALLAVHRCFEAFGKGDAHSALCAADELNLLPLHPAQLDECTQHLRASALSLQRLLPRVLSRAMAALRQQHAAAAHQEERARVELRADALLALAGLAGGGDSLAGPDSFRLVAVRAQMHG